MDEKKRRSLERVYEDMALFGALEEGLKLAPDEMTHIFLPLIENNIRINKRTVECVENGIPFVASNFTNPPEIFTAMDIHWYFIYQAAWGGGVENPHLAEDLELLDKMPIANDCCTLLRMALYYLDAGYLPRPTAWVGITEPCDGIVGVYQAISHHPEWRDIPAFSPEPTYYEDERSIKYYAGEMKRMVEFLTEHTGKTLDMDRLKEVVEETNKQYSLWHEYNYLRQSSPTPHDAVLPGSCFYVTNFEGAGHPRFTKWFEDLVEDAEKRVKENNPLVKNQKFRALWFDIPSVYYATLVPWMEEELGGTVVLDMVSYCPHTMIDTSSEDSIFEGMAKRSLCDGPMVRQARGFADNFLSDIVSIVKDFNIDLVIWPAHMGHKDGAASIRLMQDTCRELGVPFLSIGLDHVDKRYTTLDEIKDRISGFVRAMGLA